jgi:hypothetical protein
VPVSAAASSFCSAKYTPTDPPMQRFRTLIFNGWSLKIMKQIINKTLPSLFAADRPAMFFDISAPPKF